MGNFNPSPGADGWIEVNEIFPHFVCLNNFGNGPEFLYLGNDSGKEIEYPQLSQFQKAKFCLKFEVNLEKNTEFDFEVKFFAVVKKSAGFQKARSFPVGEWTSDEMGFKAWEVEKDQPILTFLEELVDCPFRLDFDFLVRPKEQYVALQPLVSAKVFIKTKVVHENSTEIWIPVTQSNYATYLPNKLVQDGKSCLYQGESIGGWLFDDAATIQLKFIWHAAMTKRSHDILHLKIPEVYKFMVTVILFGGDSRSFEIGRWSSWQRLEVINRVWDENDEIVAFVKAANCPFKLRFDFIARRGRHLFPHFEVDAKGSICFSSGPDKYTVIQCASPELMCQES